MEALRAEGQDAGAAVARRDVRLAAAAAVAAAAATAARRARADAARRRRDGEQVARLRGAEEKVVVGERLVREAGVEGILGGFVVVLRAALR
jgi:hypothetical protein